MANMRDVLGDKIFQFDWNHQNVRECLKLIEKMFKTQDHREPHTGCYIGRKLES